MLTLCLLPNFRISPASSASANPWQKPSWGDNSTPKDENLTLNANRTGNRRLRRGLPHSSFHSEVFGLS